MNRARTKVCGILVASILAAKSDARANAADAKKECAAAYEKTQSLRDEGKLTEARKYALACAAPVCPEFMVKECAAWLSQVDASLPSVVLEVRDGKGAEATSAQVSLDGAPWLNDLDGKAKPLNPGSHTIRVSIAGVEPLEQSIQIREGEKNRTLTIRFQVPGAIPPVTASAGWPEQSDQQPPPPQDTIPSRSPAPWIIGGLGLAALAAGGVMGALVLHDQSVASDPAQCSAARMLCTAAGADAQAQGRALGPATTAALVVGGVGIATAAIWLGVRRSGQKNAPAAVLGASAGVAGGVVSVRIGGMF